ncbi:hypothetical protein ITK58_19490 [Salmonella enterica]|nr:hypothetical protein ITK58_19490 [Salmonella enterica]
MPGRHASRFTLTFSRDTLDQTIQRYATSSPLVAAFLKAARITIPL